MVIIDSPVNISLSPTAVVNVLCALSNRGKFLSFSYNSG